MDKVQSHPGDRSEKGRGKTASQSGLSRTSNAGSTAIPEVSPRVWERTVRVRALAQALAIVLSAAGLGAALTVSCVKYQVHRQQQAELREVGFLNQLLSQNIRSAIELLRNQASTVSVNKESVGGSVLLWAKFSGAKPEIALNPLLKAQLVSPERLEESLQAALRSFNAKQSISIARLKWETGSSQEGLLIGFQDEKTLDGRWTAALINPSEAFPIFKALGAPQSGGSLYRAYLTHKEGLILAHSIPSYNGANFGAGPEPGIGVGLDRLPVFVARTSVAELPLDVVVEKPLSEKVSWGLLPLHHRRIQALLGALFGMTLGLAFLFLRAKKKIAKAAAMEFQFHILQKQVQESATVAAPRQPSAQELTQALLQARAPAAPSASISKAAAAAAGKTGSPSAATSSPAPGSPRSSGQPSQGKPGAPVNGASRMQTPPPAPVFQAPDEVARASERWTDAAVGGTQARQEMSDYRQAFLRVQKENEALTQFETEAFHLKDPRVVNDRMTALASRLCGSPALYFKYQPSLNMLMLESFEGFPPGVGVPGISVDADETLMNRVLQLSEQGAFASLSDYPPLAKALISRLGVGHFEAWGVTGYGPLGRQSGRPRFIGALVILKAGVDSYSRRDSLARMMRTAGLVYENAQLSQ